MSNEEDKLFHLGVKINDDLKSKIDKELVRYKNEKGLDLNVTQLIRMILNKYFDELGGK